MKARGFLQLPEKHIFEVSNLKIDRLNNVRLRRRRWRRRRKKQLWVDTNDKEVKTLRKVDQGSVCFRVASSVHSSTPRHPNAKENLEEKKSLVFMPLSVFGVVCFFTFWSESWQSRCFSRLGFLLHLLCRSFVMKLTRLTRIGSNIDVMNIYKKKIRVKSTTLEEGFSLLSFGFLFTIWTSAFFGGKIET